MEKKNKAEEDLQQLLSEMENSKKAHEHTEADEHEIRDSDPRIDVLNLPPRKEVHSEKNKRIQLKISSQLTRFIFVIVVVLGVFILVYYLNSESF